MNKTIDLKAILEQKVGEIPKPDKKDVEIISKAEAVIPANLMYSAESTEFIPVNTPADTVIGKKQLTVEEAKSFNDSISEFVEKVLVSGVDYGIIPKCSKPTLLKSGAEKIAIYLGLVFRTEVIGKTEIFEGDGFFSYSVKVYALDSCGAVMGEGVASANTKESKYVKSSAFSNQNVVLKMAKKRALVDCVLNIAGLSAFFTQDVEDMDFSPETECEPTGNDVAVPVAVSKPNGKGRPATKKQIDYLLKLVERHGNRKDALNRYIKSKYGCDDYSMLSGVQASELIEKYKAL